MAAFINAFLGLQQGGDRFERYSKIDIHPI
jgi:hypothetical protein